MQSIRIDGTDLVLSRIGFGTGSIHHLLRPSERRRLLDVAFDSGITHFDTSPYYGFGLAERELGRFLSEKQESVTVATKVGLYPPGRARGRVGGVWLRKALGRLRPAFDRPWVDGSVDVARKSLEASFNRCAVDRFDILFLHEPQAALIDTEEWQRWLEDLVRQGRIRCFGVAGEADAVERWVSEGHPLARMVQTRDSLLHREADFLHRAGRSFQITYGYMSAASPEARAASLYSAALERNHTGSILVSTRTVSRIREIAEVVE